MILGVNYNIGLALKQTIYIVLIVNEMNEASSEFS